MQNMVEEIMEQAPETAPSAAHYLGLMKSDGSFRDLTYHGSSDKSAGHLQQHGVRLKVLSLVYKWNDPGNLFHGDATLKAKILKGWSYVAAKGGFVRAPNWWWKEIGVPQGLSDGLVLMRNEIRSSVRQQVLSKYFGSVWNPSKHDGANLAYQAPIAMIDGLLRGNAGRIRDVVSKVSREISAFSGEGIQHDLSFLQHRTGGKLIYHSGSYGMVFAHDVSRSMRWVQGTTYAFGVGAIEGQVRFLVDGLAWLTRGDALDLPSLGRSITRPDRAAHASYLLRNAMVDLLPLGVRTGDLLASIDRYENGVSDANYLSGNKSFWKSDAVAHQRPEFMTTLKMVSSRIARPETAAGENQQGFYEGDGFTMIVKDGDEFGVRGGDDIIPVWDWQRLPGTTVEHNGVIPYFDMFKVSTHSSGSSNLVGAASDGQYGVAAMDYKRSGVSVTAKKAWFFFDDEFVALGADIDNNSGGAPVLTSINQVFLDGTVAVCDAAGRRTLELGSSDTLSGQSWIAHDGIGYVTLDPSNRTTVQAKLQSGSGAALPVFSAWVDHGVRPQNATYAYAVVPGVSADDLNSYAENLPVQILANTATVQAVRHLSLNQTQIAFYAAGSLDVGNGVIISVDRAANVIVKQGGGELTISAADPKQLSTPLSITVNRRLTRSGSQWSADGQSTRISFALPLAPFNGSSATRSYQLEQLATPEGEPAWAFDIAMAGVIAVKPAPPTSLSGFQASQPVSASVLQPLQVLQGRVPIRRSTATLSGGERPAQAHFGALDSVTHDDDAIDAALGIWNETGLGGDMGGRRIVAKSLR
jgi:chondroitin AC lyase